jgi:uncharacterized cupredoxin-like copper-binding protein
MSMTARLVAEAARELKVTRHAHSDASVTVLERSTARVASVKSVKSVKRSEEEIMHEDTMATPEAAHEFAELDKKKGLEDYNYEHFRTKHFLADLMRTLTSRGVQPGEVAPDFELPRSDGGTLRLSTLRGKPTLIHFGSTT